MPVEHAAEAPAGLSSRRIALVTGGMGGLGEAIAVRLHDAGYCVAVTHSPGNDHVQPWLDRQRAAGRAFGQTNYSAAKAGVHGFSKALALEVAGKGVTVNTVSPGYLATHMVTDIPVDILQTKILPQIPVGRLGRPEEVAGLITFLCSDDAAFVTGANIAINGGQHMQ